MQGIAEFQRVSSRGRSQLSEPGFPHQRCAIEVQIEAAAVQTPGAGPSQLGVFNQEPRAARREDWLADCSPRDQTARVASKRLAPSFRAIWLGDLVLDRLSKSSVSVRRVGDDRRDFVFSHEGSSLRLKSFCSLRLCEKPRVDFTQSREVKKAVRRKDQRSLIIDNQYLGSSISESIRHNTRAPL